MAIFSVAADTTARRRGGLARLSVTVEDSWLVGGDLAERSKLAPGQYGLSRFGFGGSKQNVPSVTFPVFYGDSLMILDVTSS